MRRAIVRAGLRTLSRLQVPPWVRRVTSDRRVCTIMYHGLKDSPAKGMLNFNGLHLDVDAFREQACLFAKSYNVLPLTDVAEAIRNKAEVPPNCVVLTFDDGYESNFRLGYPILQEFGLHATVFVTTGFVEGEFYQWPDRLEWALGVTQKAKLKLDFDGFPSEVVVSSLEKQQNAHLTLDAAIKRVPQERQMEAIAHIEQRAGCALGDLPEAEVPSCYRPLNWQQVREMEASDHVSIGSHTHSHLILGRASPQQAKKDMQHCHRLLRSKGGIRPTTFAYPNGKAGDHTLWTRAMLAEMGIETAVTTELGFGELDADTMQMKRNITPRNRINADMLCSGFQAKLNNFFSQSKEEGRNNFWI